MHKLNLVHLDFVVQDGFFISVKDITNYCNLRGLGLDPLDNEKVADKKLLIKLHLFNQLKEIAEFKTVIICDYHEDYQTQGFLGLSFSDAVLAKIKDIDPDFYSPRYVKKIIA